ncbi:MAG: hypothetical protein ABI947_23825 [Chloroflexota bacterium]
MCTSYLPVVQSRYAKLTLIISALVLIVLAVATLPFTPIVVNAADTTPTPTAPLPRITADNADRLIQIARSQRIVSPAEGVPPQLKFNTDGTTLITSTSAGIKLWDVNTGQERSLQGAPIFGDFAISPNGKLLALIAPKSNIESVIQIYDVETGKKLSDLAGTLFHINQFAFSPDSTNILAVAVKTGSENRPQVYRWDIATRKQINGFSSIEGLGTAIFSQDARYVAGFGQYGLEVSDLNKGTSQVLLKYSDPNIAYSFNFSPDGKYMAVADENTITILDIQTGVQISTLPGLKRYGITYMIFSPDDQILGISSDFGGAFVPYKILTGKPVQIPDVTGNMRGVLTFSPDSQLMISNTDKDIEIRTTLSSEVVAKIAGPARPVFSPDGTMLALYNDGIIRLFRVGQ